MRYWGEGHVFHSPANIRNMWDETYGWFDAFLKPLTDLGHTESQPGSTGRPGR